ncbi:S8 family serine peptidase [Candidatus Chlorohelix allophototropha]|uniref:S8 family serine peptidase n=1 Tax=Candidatus Chlorohelix allophototropha TaxID=3003348 RepID=A0ABY9B2C7_9CHLR|nr:S8 family serine peptidase [Chloroflexota bacterium L227-S17]
MILKGTVIKHGLPPVLCLIWVLLANLLLLACGTEPTPAPHPVIIDSKTDTMLSDLLLKYNTGGLDAARQFAHDSGLLDEQDRVRFELTLDSSTNLPTVKQKLEQMGAIVTASYEHYLSIRVSLPELVKRSGQQDFWNDLGSLSAVRDLKVILQPPTADIFAPQEGLKATGAEVWQQAGYNGKGVKVGIIDSGFAGFRDYFGNGLPPSNQVTFQSFVYGEGEGSGKHGVSVSEIINSYAPEAQLYLAAIEDEIGFAKAVNWLMENRVQIIQVSLAWGGLWPSDGSSLLSSKLTEARNAGALPVVSAGNYGRAHYAGNFKPDTNGFNRFGSTEGAITLKFTATSDNCWVSLRWDENWDAPSTNLDLYILDENKQPKGSSRNLQGDGSNKPPVELAPFHAEPNRTYYIQVRNAGKGGEGVHFNLYAYNASFEEYDPSGSLAAPGDAKGAITVGAVSWRDNTLEPYSSRGPTQDGRKKPELVAPTGVTLRSVGQNQVFSGTSAAAPQVAGIAAVILSAAPALNANQLETYLHRNIQPFKSEDPNATGWGEAHFGAIEALQGGVAELLGAEVAGPVVNDNFTDYRGGLPDNYQAYYGTLPDGTTAYFVRVGKPNELNWSVYSNRIYREFKIDFTAGFSNAVKEDGYFYGVLFWQRSATAYYLFCVSGNAFAVLERNGDSWREIVPWTASNMFNINSGNLRFSLEATAGYLKIKAQGMGLISVPLQNPTLGGNMGFVTGKFGGTAAITGGIFNQPLAMFSDLAITPLSSQ